MGGDVADPFECGGPSVGVCLYSTPGTGVGDAGFCAAICLAQDDCAAPSLFCYNINLPAGGVCLPAQPCTSNVDCDFTDAECITTTAGKFCMSPSYPLGSLEP